MAIITTYKLRILQCYHIFKQGAFTLFGIVGASFISCISAKPFASKAATKANKTGKDGVILFMIFYVLILFRSYLLW